jgi:O-antigen ligase
VNRSARHNIVWLVSTAFIAAVFCAAYFQFLYLLLLPPALLAVFYLVQNPVPLFYLLVASIPWSVEYNFSNGLGTDLPDEPLMLLCAFTVVAALAFNWKKYKDRLHPILFVLLLYLVWIVITVYTSTDRLLSLKYMLAKLWYVLAFVGAPLLFLKDRKALLKAAVILVISMMAATLLVVIKHAGSNFSFESANLAPAPFFRNHVNYAALLVFTVPLQIAFLQSKRYRALIICTLVFTIAALYVSYSRGAWLALVVGLASYWLIRRKLMVAAFVFTILLTLSAIFWLKKDENYLAFAHDFNTTIYHADFSEHLAATYEFRDASTAERFHRWIAGVRMIPDRWQTGFGPNTFYWNYKSYTVPAFKTWISKNEERSTVHNYFLLQAIEMGIPGLLLFLALLFALFFYAQKTYHRSTDPFTKTAAITTASVLSMICTVNVLSDLIEADKVGSIFFVCIAVLVGLTDNR